MTQGNNLKTLSGVQRLLEGGLIFCCMIATYILLALSSFSPNDPGWSQSHFQGKIQNWTGAVGAWTADVLFYFFGFIAYSIPVIIAATGWFFFNRAHRLLEVDYFSVGLRIIGFMLMVLALAAMVSMNVDDIYVFSAGGVAGDVISQAMLPYFNILGTTLLLLCFIGAGFTLATGISWLTIIELLGRGVIWLAKKIWQLPQVFKRERETEDTRGFMSVVDKFRQRRESGFDDELSHSFNANVDEKKASPLRNIQSLLKTDKPHSESNQPTPSKLDANKSSVEEDRSTSIVEKKRSIFSRKVKPEPLEPQVDSEIDEDDDDERLEPKMFQQDINDLDPSFTSWSEDDEVRTPSFSAIDDLDDDLDDIDDSRDEFEFEQVHSTGALVAQQQPKKEAKIVDGIVLIDGQTVQHAKKPMTPLPSISLLDVPDRKKNPISEEELEQVARLVEMKLADFNIIANVVGVYPGPVVTRFELELAPGVKASKITNLSKDLARSLLSENVRVVEVIPGKAYVGIELPNKFRETVYMRDVLDSDAFRDSKSTLSMVLGQDISGEPVIVDLGKMPHLLVAGTTGSGKSVGVNVMITSLLYKSGPDDVRFIMIDPKMLELSVYEGIPHLLCEVVTDMKEAANALRWCVGEMERRYKLMSALGVRNLKGYNIKIKEAAARGEYIPDPLWKQSESMLDEAPPLDKLPAIVVVVDEFADMIMIVGKKVEELIARIAQKARAAGIHLILATQRPSVDVITGLIKANIPTRIAFQVSSRIDSRTILDQQGAETLLGMGDMLYLPPGTSVPNRVHGAFIDDHEVHKVVADWCERGKPQYVQEILNGISDGEQVLLPGETGDSDDELDALYDDAVAFVTETRRGSISSVQRKFKIGYNRAARIIESMEAQGIVSSQGHNGNREVLAPPPPRN
ncbi:DNA translocase FtsK 4TM domain-containing protein [Shewanella sp. OMA3-2]|uniref:DNA translocase FtsK 4TM domain-containing protein n=1 Tax=Shewanella sp. OMA3-2 TaxID=2908650 RepID=UPI001F3E44B3|nr:DNA translocase FtsK 4TM domain-containing protein [Shewanella sp. OMA3-2]UJF20944.1 DNA translocase FtsK 4TM domain-containing protein [Shewanella sp. OMA3-2]